MKKFKDLKTGDQVMIAKFGSARFYFCVGEVLSNIEYGKATATIIKYNDRGKFVENAFVLPSDNEVAQVKDCLITTTYEEMETIFNYSQVSMKMVHGELKNDQDKGD